MSAEQNTKLELLAPGGDTDAIKAAIAAGADAVYCGLDKFNARNRAGNISFEELQGVLRLAHKHNTKVFLTLNILIAENEITALIKLLNKLLNTGIDGIIVQDLGLLYLLSRYFKGLEIHASTQMTTHNEGQVKFLSELNVSRINLSRELNIHEISELTAVAKNNNILSEVFVHGSYCISFSGLCYMSSVQSGNSGNRGRCSQPCRDRYVTSPAGKDYPFNLKDNSAWFDLKELTEAGVASLKIEGRIKKSDYVYTVTKAWKDHIREFLLQHKPDADNSVLYKVFNRDFSNGYLSGDISREMFIDNPRDHSIEHLSEINSYATDIEKEKDHLRLYKEKEEIKANVENIIKDLSIEKEPISIIISGKCGEVLKVRLKTPSASFVEYSSSRLVKKGAETLNEEMILKRFRTLNDTGYNIEQLSLENLQKDLFIPFKELSSLKKRLLQILNESGKYFEAIKVPALKNHKKQNLKPGLSVLISSPKDIALCNKKGIAIYYQLPEGFKNSATELTTLFQKNKTLIPWFPAILIGEDYRAAIDFLQVIRPAQIVTNNSGIAYEAYKQGISWIAGPFLNIVNSFSLLALKENFHCAGSFISNELSQYQIRQIKCPENFELYYSIYHPIQLMTSRQCLLHQLTGCEKSKMDSSCIANCEKSASVSNLKNQRYLVNKTKENYHSVYNEFNFLNLEILKDLPNIFSAFLIDLRDINTGTTREKCKSEMIHLFENFINGTSDAEGTLKQNLQPTTSNQYKRGI